MCETEPGCRRCSRQYSKLLSEYWYQRRQIRKILRAARRIHGRLELVRVEAADGTRVRIAL